MQITVVSITVRSEFIIFDYWYFNGEKLFHKTTVSTSYHDSLRPGNKANIMKTEVAKWMVYICMIINLILKSHKMLPWILSGRRTYFPLWLLLRSTTVMTTKVMTIAITDAAASEKPTAMPTFVLVAWLSTAPVSTVDTAHNKNE